MRTAQHPLTSWIAEQIGDGDLVVVTTSAKAAAAQRSAVLRAVGAVGGVEFVAARGLAEAVLRRAGAVSPLRAPEPLEEREALRAALAAVPGPVSRYAARFPAALQLLLGTIKELERAGWPEPDDPLEPRGAHVRALGERLHAHPASAARASRWTLLRRATVAAPQLAPGSLRVCLAGHAEPEGDLRLLLDALRAADVPMATSPLTTQAPARRAYRTTAHPGEELRVAAADCLRRFDEGTPWDAMVIAAPRLGPYAPLVREAFAAEGVPVATIAETPLLREPRAALALHLARLLFDSAPRTSWLAVAGSPLLRKPLPAAEVQRLERVSREHLLIGRGAGARAALQRLKHAPRARSLLRKLLDEAQAFLDPVPIESCVVALRATLDRLTLAPADERDVDVQERLAEVLHVLPAAADGPVSGARLLREFEDLLRTRGVPIADPGGVHLVEYRDALSFPAATLDLIGLAADQQPSPPPADLFLSNADRRRLPGVADRETTRLRERLLLSRLLRHPIAELTLSRPRTTAGGIAVGPSLALQHVERELGGLPAITELPTHPFDRAARRVAAGSCPRDRALVHLTLANAGDDALIAAAGAAAAPTLAITAALERFDAGDRRRDGFVGAALGRELLQQTFSVSSFDSLGTCPQQFLFRGALRIKALPPEPDPTRLPHNRLGSLVHDVLHRVYQSVADELRQGALPSLLTPRVKEHAATLLRAAMADEAAHIRREFPALFELRCEQWIAALHEVIAFDVERLQLEHSRIHALEHEVNGEVRAARPGAMPVAVRLRGRIDRIDKRSGGGVRVIDYKTGNPDASVKANDILRGRRLQLPVYAMLLEATAERTDELEVLSVRPAAHDSDRVGPQVALRETERFLRGSFRQGLEETLATLGELIGEGNFGMVHDSEVCRWCDFRLACRRLHPPSVERVRGDASPARQRFVQLSEKSTRAPLLAPEAAP